MTALSTVIGRGATGSKPAADAVPVGSLYFDTTLGKLQRSTGAAWEDCAETASVSFSDAEGDPADVAATAADGTSEYPARRDHAHKGSMVAITRTVVGAGGAASFDFTSIPATFEDLVIDVLARSDNGSENATVLLRLNNDSGNNYDAQNIQGIAATALSAETIGGSSIPLWLIPAATGTAGKAGYGRITIIGYARTVFQKVVIGNAIGVWGQASGKLQSQQRGGCWRDTSAINRVTILTSGNFVEGSVATLYGVL